MGGGRDGTLYNADGNLNLLTVNADDFVFLHHDQNHLGFLVQSIELYLQTVLQLKLHPNKVSITTVASGVDFLGWVQFPYHSVLRGVARKRVMKQLRDPVVSEASRRSYLGLLRHGDAYGLLHSICKDGDN
jgi:hypothetical protein